MSIKDRLIYSAVVAFVVFFLGQFVMKAGVLWVNVVYSIAMGLFAFLAVSLAARIGRGKKD